VFSGWFTASAVNQNNVVTVPAAAPTIFGSQAQPGSGTITMAAATSVTGTNVNVRLTPSWTTIVPTTVRVSYTVHANGMTYITPQ
jgi:hypothetical protein